jgi:photosystem II stability/assembly factor-like uncharacterized protein
MQSSGDGYAGGNNGGIYKTTNGGSNWVAQTSGTTSTISSIFFIDENTGYAAGASGVILKTTNGGTNWIAQTSGTAINLNSLFFTSSSVGYAAGLNGIIVKTTNGGISFINKTQISESGFNIYPNPSNSKITITAMDELQNETKVSIYNVQGEVILSNTFQNTIEITTSSLSKGIYLVKIQTDKGIETKKLIIE